MLRSPDQSRKPHRWLATGLTLVAVAALGACGADRSSDASSESSSPRTNALPLSSTYSGVDDKFPSDFPPAVGTSKPLKVGYLQIINSIPVLSATATAAQEEVERLGGDFVLLDAQLDPQKQVAQFDQLLAQNVDAILVYPVVAEALGPQLEKAASAGVPVVSMNAQADGSNPLPSGITADVEQSFDFESFELAKALAEAKPGGSFALIGLGAPVEALDYLASRQEYWGKQFGLDYLGTVEAKADSPDAYTAAMTALLGRYPDVDGVMTYNDLVAMTAAITASGRGLTDVAILGAQGGDKTALQAIKEGAFLGTYRAPWEETGRAMVSGAYAAVAGRDFPKRLALRGEVVTKDNVDQVTSVG